MFLQCCDGTCLKYCDIPLMDWKIQLHWKPALRPTKSTVIIDHPFTPVLHYPTFASTPYTLGPIYNLPTNPHVFGMWAKTWRKPSQSQQEQGNFTQTTPEIRIKPESLVLHHCVTLTVTISDSNKRSSPQIIFP